MGGVVTIFFNLSIPVVGAFTLPFLSVICAFITILLVIFFAQKIERSMKVETIILTGVIFSSFLGAFISLMIALTGDELRQIIGWLLVVFQCVAGIILKLSCHFLLLEQCFY